MRGIKLLLIAPLCLFTLFYGYSIGSNYMPSKADLAEIKNIKKAPLEERFSSRGLVFGHPVFIRIFKEESLLEIWVQNGHQYKLFDTYEICTFSGKLGPKLKEGDKQAPEGFYTVAKSQLNPNSRFHLSFNIGFPNRYDRSHDRTGSFLMIHGGCVSIGCYAMTNEYIEDIYMIVENALDHGQKRVPIHIFPFRMSAERLASEEASKWYSFWENLKTGYDLFEDQSVPPQVSVRNKSYQFTVTSTAKAE